MPLLFGRRPVFEALSNKNSLQKIYVAQETQGLIIDQIIRMAKEQGISVVKIQRKEIESMFPGEVHQGIVAEKGGSLSPEYSLDELLKDRGKYPSPPFFLILDRIEDPHNLGAIIRTANGAGVHAVIIPKHRSSGITPAVIKASAGATESTPIVKVSNLVNTCRILKKKGLWIIGTYPSTHTLWFQVDLTCPLAIILGGEAKGMSRLLREECDFIVSVPMLGRISSLNVSVTAGILMYDVIRQRMNKK